MKQRDYKREYQLSKERGDSQRFVNCCDTHTCRIAQRIQALKRRTTEKKWVV